MLRRTLGEKVFNVFNYLILIVLCVVTIYPLWHVLMASLSDPSYVYTKRGFFFYPAPPMNFLGYSLVLENPNITTGFLNTLFYVVAGTILSMFITITGAYVLSRRGVYWNKAIMKGIVFTMYFQGGLIPFYLLVLNLGMRNTVWSILLPVAVNTFNLIIMRTAFDSVSESYVESAKLDGASDWRIIWQIMVPLAQATVAVIALYYGVYRWNDWFNPSIFLNDKTMYPLQLVLREILINNDTNGMTPSAVLGQTGVETYRLLVKYCTIIVGTVPVLIIYPFLQKYFVKGIMIGGVKG